MRATFRVDAQDLFGEVPVSQADIVRWLDALPRLSKAPWRRAAYSRAYDVVGKIRAAKAAGRWPPIELREF